MSGSEVYGQRRTDDAYPNEIMVAGALWMAISARFNARPVMVDGEATNELYVWPDFMRSRYRVTVTLDPEDDQAAVEATIQQLVDEGLVEVVEESSDVR